MLYSQYSTFKDIMSENKQENEENTKNTENTENTDIKEDFSGFTEVTDKEQQSIETPRKIDVSEAVAQAQAQDAIPSELQLPQLPRTIGPLYREHRKPSFWQILMSRGFTILVVVVIGALAWWLWTSRNNIASVDANGVESKGIINNIVEKVQKSLKLPPNL